MAGLAEIFGNQTSRFQPLIRSEVFDTLLFSDLYRRGVMFENCKFALAKELAAQIRNLGIKSTYHYTEIAKDQPDNISNMEECVRLIRDIDWRVNEIGAKKLVLPFGGEGNIFAERLKAALENTELKTKVTLRRSEYDFDLSEIGPVKADKKTIFDQGIRGVCHYQADLRYQWDREIA